MDRSSGIRPGTRRPQWAVAPTRVLVIVVATLMTLAAGTGLLWSGGASFENVTARGEVVEVYGHGLYRHDALLAGAGHRGVDGALLLVALPTLLLAARAHRRGSAPGTVLLAATLTAILYVYVTLALGAAYNELLLVYTTISAASALALAQVLATLDPVRLRDAHAPRAAKALSAFMIAAAALAGAVWLALILEPQLTGTPPALGGATTYFTPAIDFAFVLPAILLAGVWVRRGQPAGYVLAVPMLGILVFLGPALVGQLVAQTLAGVAFTPQELAVFFATFAVMSGGGVLAFASVLRAAAAPRHRAASRHTAPGRPRRVLPPPRASRDA